MAQRRICKNQWSIFYCHLGFGFKTYSASTNLFSEPFLMDSCQGSNLFCLHYLLLWAIPHGFISWEAIPHGFMPRFKLILPPLPSSLSHSSWIHLMRFKHLMRFTLFWDVYWPANIALSYNLLFNSLTTPSTPVASS